MRIARALRRLNEATLESTGDTGLSPRGAQRLDEGEHELDGWMGSAVSGLCNAIAPPVRNLGAQGGVYTATVVFGTAYEGPPGHVHGGWVSCIFDEVLAAVMREAGIQGVTGTLTVRYRNPTPLHRELRTEVWLEAAGTRKAIGHGRLLDGDTLCAEGEAIFVARSFDSIRARATDPSHDA